MHTTGFGFDAPPGWSVRPESDGQFLLAPPGADSQAEGYVLGHIGGLAFARVDDPAFARATDDEMAQLLPFLRRTGEPEKVAIPFGPAIALTYAGATPTGVALRARAYVTLFADGAILLLAFGRQEMLVKREADLMALLATVRRAAAPPAAAVPAGGKTDDGSAMARQWAQRLAGMKLTHLESYSSGSAGGYSSRVEAILTADGRYSYRSSSSVSVNVEGASGSSGGRHGSEGRWRVVSRGGRAFLELTPDGGTPELLELVNREGKTYIGGRRYFVTEP